MTQEFTTSKGSFLIVKVPEDKNGMEVTIHGNESFLNVWGVEDIKLTSGNWQIVGDPFDLNEEQAHGVVNHKTENLYDDFDLPQEFIYYPDGDTALEALSELLKSLKIYQTNPYYKDRMSIEFYYDCGEISKHDLDETVDKWHEAEERVFKSAVLLKKI